MPMQFCYHEFHPKTPLYDKSMDTSRFENLRKIVNEGHGERIPFTLDVGAIPGFTEPALARFRQESGAEQPEEFFDYDFRTVSLRARFGGDNPAALHASIEPGTVFDEWGIGHWAGGAAGTYEKTYPPLATAECIADIDALPVPIIEPEDAQTAIAEYHKRGYPVWGYAGSVYEWSWWLRGMEEFMMDMAGDPAMAEAVVSKVAGYTKSLALATAQAGIDVLCFYDDAGMQTGMQLSPDMWRKTIKPHWCDILDTVRRSFPDCIFFLHSCGKIEAIIPDIIDAGFHILHPIQPECMDFAAIRKEYGKRITLCACMSSQQLFPFGTPNEVKTWVRHAKELCASDNRCILCPSNRIQPETPWENVLAFAEAARE